MAHALADPAWFPPPCRFLSCFVMAISRAGLWLLNGAGWWSMENRQTGQLVGSVGAFFRYESTVMEMAAAAVLNDAFEVRR